MKNSLRLPWLICELANSHGGSADSVDALIQAFAALKFPKKGIKFQVFQADTLALPDFAWHKVYKQLEFSPERWQQFIAAATKHGSVWIDVFDRYSISIVEQNIGLVSGMKLQASVLENDEVIQGLRSLDLKNMTLAINVSGHQLDDISRFVATFEKICPNLVLQIGFQSYPTAIADTALQKIPILKAAFPGLAVSMADHADGAEDFAKLAPLHALAMGCSYIEKHMCVSRASAPYDGYSALEADQMQQLGDRILAFHQASNGNFIGERELAYLTRSVQAPILRHDCKEGQRLTLSDLLFRRTAQKGIPWSAIDTLQGKGQVLSSAKTRHQTLAASDFRPARVAAIVACRMKSSRLKKKALLPIAGVPSVERCLHQCLAIPGADKVILATSTLPEDAVLGDYLAGGAAEFWQGDPEDVISRYVGACDHFDVDVVVRITADCPLISPEIIAYLLDSHFRTGADYTTVAKSAVGTSASIINAAALRKVIELMGRAEHSEYMTWYFKNNPETFDLNIVELPAAMVRDYRLTLDHQEDLDLFEALYARLPPGNEAKRLEDVFKVLDESPEIAQVNAHIELKYVTDQNLISMLNEKTKLPEKATTASGSSR